MHRLIVLLLLLTPVWCSAQKKFIQSLDTAYRPANAYIEEYDEHAYFNGGIGDATIDVFGPDTQLLNAALYFAIDKWRNKKGRGTYHFNEELQRLGEAYTGKYNTSRFERTVSNNLRVTKLLKKIPRYHSFNFKLMDGNVRKSYIVDYKRGRFFYYRKDEETALKLYRGSREDMKDTTKVLKPIEEITYDEFAERTLEQLVRGAFGKALRSRSYELVGVSVFVDPRTVGRNKIPQAKVIVLLGGYRNKLLIAAMQDD